MKLIFAASNKQKYEVEYFQEFITGLEAKKLLSKLDIKMMFISGKKVTNDEDKIKLKAKNGIVRCKLILNSSKLETPILVEEKVEPMKDNKVELYNTKELKDNFISIEFTKDKIKRYINVELDTEKQVSVLDIKSNLLKLYKGKSVSQLILIFNGKRYDEKLNKTKIDCTTKNSLKVKLMFSESFHDSEDGKVTMEDHEKKLLEVLDKFSIVKNQFNHNLIDKTELSLQIKILIDFTIGIENGLQKIKANTSELLTKVEVVKKELEEYGIYRTKN